MEQRYNMKTSQNGFLISIYQEGPSHKPYFKAVNMEGQAIIGPNKKIVAIYIIGKLVLLD